MKYVWAALAIVAAVAALFFRPPQGDRGQARPAASGAAADSAGAHFGPGNAPSDGTLGSSRKPAVRPGSRQAHPAAPRIVVYVAGEVNKPGVYAFAAGTRAQEALTRAGGPKPDADLVAVNLAAPLDDGAEIAVPKIGATSARTRRSAGPRIRAAHASRGRGRGHGRRRRNGPQDAPVRSVDLNAADASELETLPGIGPALAERIVDYRNFNGPFISVDELADVSGITPHLEEELAGFVVIR